MRGRALPPPHSPFWAAECHETRKKWHATAQNLALRIPQGVFSAAALPTPPGKKAGLPKGNNMCRPVKCRNCGKTTWAGCCEHVDQIKASVPAGQWCTCTRENSASSSSSGGFLAGLFGRK